MINKGINSVNNNLNKNVNVDEGDNKDYKDYEKMSMLMKMILSLSWRY
jgi:hypothetical protein